MEEKNNEWKMFKPEELMPYKNLPPVRTGVIYEVNREGCVRVLSNMQYKTLSPIAGTEHYRFVVGWKGFATVTRSISKSDLVRLIFGKKKLVTDYGKT
jgi:hypothetical protein